jgi:LacI family transcriptional regulator
MAQTTRATIKDVAERSGTSITTVSHVLNEVPGKRVSAETRQRVRRAAQDLGYRPNQLAKGLRTQRSQTIGFISDHVLTTPFASRMIAGVQHAAAEAGSLVLLVNSEGDPELGDAQVDALLERQVDGIVYATVYHKLITPPAGLRQAPAVLLDARSTSGTISSVVPDEQAGARAATEELLAAGHRRIGFVNNEEDIPAQLLRLAGYQDALAAYDVAIEPSLEVREYPAAYGGYAGALRLLQSDDRPTALFCATDWMAMGAYQACQDLELRIPDDVSIVGFDDHELVAGSLRPGLTTMALPHYGMGHWAVLALLRQIDNGDSTVQHAVLACPIVRRASVGPPPPCRF